MSSPSGDINNKTSSLQEWWTSLSQLKLNEEMEGVAVIMWELWQNRNDYVGKVKSRPAPVIVSSALGFLARWKSARAQCLVVADPSN